MLRIVPSKNAHAATKYFTEGLSRGDYYAAEPECKGVWRGKGAWQLGLTGEGRSGEVTREQFAAMAMNRHPTQDGPLTERTVSNRRVGYDFNYNPPKSVSIVYEETQDEQLLEAFRSSVHETMEQIEQDMKCRVRVGGAQHDRTVGNLCWAEFIHHTARPVDGFPDQQLHAHCYAFNAVWDGVEQKWKAGQFGDIKRDAPFYEASFHARLASKVVDLGFSVERRGKSWEIAAVPEEVVRQCSRRTAGIEAKASELGIHDAERKSKLGAQTRKKKNTSIPMDELRKIWSERLGREVRAAIHSARLSGRGSFGKGIEQDPKAAIDFAAGKCFERESVITEKELLTAAMRRSLGSAPLETLQRVIQNDSKFIRSEMNGEKVITTKEIMAEEERMLAFARKGRGSRLPLAPEHTIRDQRLNEEQRAAVMHCLQSTDRIVMIQGGAGTGKTTLMTEAIDAINGSWFSRSYIRDAVTVLAPTADAGRDVLRNEGFKNADTVAKFLQSKEMQKRAMGGVLWIDEAGLLGSRGMAQLCKVAHTINARLILSGDPAQHRAVERGDPLRLFEQYAAVRPAEVHEIQRQQGLYKSAVEHLSRGDVGKGFNSLTKLGWVHENNEPESHRQIAYDYATTIEKGRTALIVSPTHAEGRRVTQAVRGELDRRGTLRGTARTFDRLEDLRWTEAEKKNADLYTSGMIVQFHQNVPGFKAGERYTITNDVHNEGIFMDNFRRLPLKNASKFTVYQLHKNDTDLKKGDLIRITANGRSVKAPAKPFHPRRQHAINNGAHYQVAGFTLLGDIRLENGWVVDKTFGHFTHGYCITSNASQSKTIDRVLIAQSANSFGATSAQQFLVSVSRGRKECAVYTDDADGLRRCLEKSAHKPLAVDLSERHEQQRLESLAAENAKRRAYERAQEMKRENTRARAATMEANFVG